jgi:hypothetical protein
MTNDSKTKKWTEKNDFNFDEIISKVKWFFQKNEKNWREESKNSKKVFTLTRKDSMISVCVALVIVAWAIFYGMIVLSKYSTMNNDSEELKKLSAYNLRVDENLLSSYSDWKDIANINALTSIYDNIEEELESNKLFEEQQKSYYEILLQNIYLPSLNVWKDPYTKNFDMTVLWQKYLDNDKFQDLYLIQYRSDFVKYVWNDSDYNNVENITIGDILLYKNQLVFASKDIKNINTHFIKLGHIDNIEELSKIFVNISEIINNNEEYKITLVAKEIDHTIIDNTTEDEDSEV